MEDTVPTGENVLNVVLDRIKTSGRVEIIYGESREMHGKTIIPIAAVLEVTDHGSDGSRS